MTGTLLLWNNCDVELPDGLNLEGDRKPADNVNVSIVTKDDGDYRISYNNEDSIQTSAAQIMFDRMLAEGMECYKIEYKKPKKGEEDAPPEEAKRTKLKKFDPKATDLIFIPLKAAVGG